MDEGVFQNAINPEVVMEAIYVLYDGAVRTERYKTFRVSPLDLLLNTIVVYIRGFCTPKGIIELDDHIQSFKAFGKSNNTKQKVENLV